MDSIQADKLLAYSEFTKADFMECDELALRVLATPSYAARRVGPLRNIIDRLIQLGVGLVSSTPAVLALTA